MAKKILVSYDFGKNEIQNAVAQVLASAPGSPVAGQFYYDSTDGRWKYRNASAWIDPSARGDHTGTQLASTISDFNTAVRTNRLDQMATPTAAVAMGSQRLTGLADPTSAQDAATKTYVDGLVNGLDWKASVRAATTANITLSGAQTIDGVSVVAGERVLVKDQSTPTQNGLYLCASGAWTRTVDADGAGELTPRTTVAVEEGTVSAGFKYTVTNTGAITIGVTNITWAVTDQGGVTYTEGNGIDISGSVISVDPAVTVRKYASNVGSSTSVVITHSLNTLDVIVQVYEISTGATVECDVVRNSTSQVTLGFAVAPTADTLRVVVHA